MKIYLVLLPFLMLSQNNLWSWQTTTAMTKKEIAGQLQEKRAALTALLEKNNLSLEAVLSAQQLTIVQQVDAVLGIAEAPQDIGKKAFVEYVQDWVTGIKSTLSTCDRTDVQVSVLDAKTSFVGYVHNVKFPISAKLWKSYLKPALDDLGELATPKAIAEAMTGALEEFEQYIQNKFEQTEHFKKNKATYAKIKKKQLEGVLMTAGEFNTWLNKAIAEGKELEEKQEALDKEQKEKQEASNKEKQQEEKAFKEAFIAWKANQNAQIKDIISQDKGTDSTHNMSKAKFIAILLDYSKGWKEQPELGQEISQSIVNNLKGDSLTIKDYVNAMSYAYNHITTPESIIAKHWYEWRGFFDIAGVLTALVTENTGTSQYDIVEEYIQWFGKVGGVVDSLKLSSNRQFVADKLIAGLEATLNTPELSIFLPPLTTNIKAHQKNFLSLQETSMVWKSSIGQLIKNPSTLLATQAGTKVDSALLDSLDQLLMGEAGVDTLQRVFQQALRPLPKPDALAKGEAINLTIELNDGTILHSKIITQIDKANKVPFAVPSSLDLNVSKGKSAYDFVAKPILSQSPVVRSNNQVTVDFEYTIEFSMDKGSSQVGGSTEVEVGTETHVDKTVEHSKTQGREKTKTEGTVSGWNGASTTGFTGEANLNLLLFKAKGEVSQEVTVGYHKDKVEETSETVSSSETTTTGTTVGKTNSYEVSDTESWSATRNHGNDNGYFTIKGYLTSSEVDQEIMVLSIEGLKFSSPDMKGFSLIKITPTTNKTVRWKK